MELAVSASQLLLESVGNADTTIKYINKFRFLKKIGPGQTLTLNLKYIKDTEHGQEIDAAIFIKDERVSYGSFLVSKKPQNKAQESCRQFLTEGYQRYNTKMPRLAMGTAEIAKLLPHRYPFIHIDGIIELIPGQRIKTLKNISANDYVFWGKEPGTPFPPLLMLEGLQGSAIVCNSRLPLMSLLSGVSFLGDVYPGDQMIVEISVLKTISDKHIITGNITVGNQVVFNLENAFLM